MAQRDRTPSTSGTRGRGPEAAEVRAELARILESRAFAQAGRASEFLRFVVEETLGGRADRLKGYTVAIEVFGRPADFDAQSDPLVRVEAGRLRRRLAEYYAGEGRADPVRIELPRGAYAARFARVVPDGNARQARPRRSMAVRHAVPAGAAALLAVSLGVAAWLAWSPRPGDAPPPVPAGFGPRVLVEPFVNLNGAEDLDRFAYGITEEIVLRLTERDISVIAHYTGMDGAPGLAGPASVDGHGAGYLLTGSVRRGAGATRIAVRLVDAATGAQLWTRAYDETVASDGPSAVQQAVAIRIAAILVDPFGPMYARETAAAAAKPAAELTIYDCVLKFYDYGRHLDEARHLGARDCLLAQLERADGAAAGWAALALVHLHEHLYGYNPFGGAPALERAREAVRTALDIDGRNLLAIFAMIGVRFASGEMDEFFATTERFLALDPPPSGGAQVGMLLALSGQWERGIRLIDAALEHAPDPPGWFYVPEALYYLRVGDHAAALDWALRIDAPDWYVAPLTVAATAAYAGRDELARRSVERLLELVPELESEGRARLRRWHVDDPLLEQLIAGLRLAGVEIR